MGRCSRFASAGVATAGLDAMTNGTSRPSVVLPIDPNVSGNPSAPSESRKFLTSAYRDVSRYAVTSGRVRGGEGGPLRWLPPVEHANTRIDTETAANSGRRESMDRRLTPDRRRGIPAAGAPFQEESPRARSVLETAH